MSYNEYVDWRFLDGIIPSRQFFVGEPVIYGSHENAEIVEMLHDGASYKIRSWGTREVYGTPTPYESTHTVHWYDIYKIPKSIPDSLIAPHKYRMSNSSRCISGLISMIHNAGVDMDPEYQREYVWTTSDKVKLIDSIFNHINIGMFVFGQRNMDTVNKLYEIIDGKQRLTALVEFSEDRFKYKGYYFSQLCRCDQHHFDGYTANVGIMERPTDKEKLAAFLAVNTYGKRISQKHLDKVQVMYDNV